MVGSFAAGTGPFGTVGPILGMLLTVFALRVCPGGHWLQVSHISDGRIDEPDYVRMNICSPF